MAGREAAAEPVVAPGVKAVPEARATAAAQGAEAEPAGAGAVATQALAEAAVDPESAERPQAEARAAIREQSAAAIAPDRELRPAAVVQRPAIQDREPAVRMALGRAFRGVAAVAPAHR